MTLKQQIEATIKVYEEACKFENLNFVYCIENDIEYGICKYSQRYDYDCLSNFTIRDVIGYIAPCPMDLAVKNNIVSFKIALQKAHKKRISYLKQLLTDAEN